MTDNNEPTFHGRMMSIPIPNDRLPSTHLHDVESAERWESWGSEPDDTGDIAWAAGYKMGHHDARHAAAEIANEADEAIRELQMQVDDLARALDRERAIAKNFRERREEALEQVDALTKAAEYVTAELRSAVGRLGLRPALADALKGADPDKATAEQLARFLWLWSHDTSSSSASDAAMRFIGDDRGRFAAAINEARAWMQAHRGGEWVGWSCAVLTGTQEVSSPGWYALPPGQWPGEPCIVIERVERDGLELPTVAEAVATMGVTVKVEE